MESEPINPGLCFLSGSLFILQAAPPHREPPLVSKAGKNLLNLFRRGTHTHREFNRKASLAFYLYNNRNTALTKAGVLFSPWDSQMEDPYSSPFTAKGLKPALRCPVLRAALEKPWLWPHHTPQPQAWVWCSATIKGLIKIKAGAHIFPVSHTQLCTSLETNGNVHQIREWEIGTERQPLLNLQFPPKRSRWLLF